MGTAGRKQEQFMVLVNKSVMSRMDSLRIVMGVSRAEINRKVLEGGQTLAQLEEAHTDSLARLGRLGLKIGMTEASLVHAIVSTRKKIPTLAQLEELTKAELMNVAGGAAMPERERAA